MKPSEQPTCKPPISPCTLQAPVGDPLQALANDVCVGPAQRTTEAYRDLESRNGCQRLTGLSELYSLENALGNLSTLFNTVSKESREFVDQKQEYQEAMPTGQNDRAPPLSAHTCVPSECLEKALQAENSDL